jgi:hypothetical protein
VQALQSQACKAGWLDMQLGGGSVGAPLALPFLYELRAVTVQMHSCQEC